MNTEQNAEALKQAAYQEKVRNGQDVVSVILTEQCLNRGTVTLSELPLPAQVNLDPRFDEEDFEDYLDFWLSKKYEDDARKTQQQ